MNNVYRVNFAQPLQNFGINRNYAVVVTLKKKSS